MFTICVVWTCVVFLKGLRLLAQKLTVILNFFKVTSYIYFSLRKCFDLPIDICKVSASFCGKFLDKIKFGNNITVKIILIKNTFCCFNGSMVRLWPKKNSSKNMKWGELRSQFSDFHFLVLHLMDSISAKRRNNNNN